MTTCDAINFMAHVEYFKDHGTNCHTCACCRNQTRCSQQGQLLRLSAQGFIPSMLESTKGWGMRGSLNHCLAALVRKRNANTQSEPFILQFVPVVLDRCLAHVPQTVADYFRGNNIAALLPVPGACSPAVPWARVSLLMRRSAVVSRVPIVRRPSYTK